MINILIVDDSATDAAILRYIFESEPDFNIVGIAKNGKEAIELTAKLNPDLVTMDLQMPFLDGFEAIKHIMASTPVPIVVISSILSDKEINATFHALEAGALATLDKPRNITAPEFQKTKKHMLDLLRSMAQIKPIKRRKFTSTVPKPISKPLVVDTTPRAFEIVAIGASVGGPHALRLILSALPADFPTPIVIVQHMSKGFINGFAAWLNEKSKLTVKAALHDERLVPGTVYLAPDQYHLTVYRKENFLHTALITGLPVSGFCPSITVLLNSVAKVSGKNAIGILLTGMGSDGSHGLVEIKNAKGHTFVQDSASSVVFGMASVAQTLGGVEKVIELERIAEYLIKICKR